MLEKLSGDKINNFLGRTIWRLTKIKQGEAKVHIFLKKGRKRPLDTTKRLIERREREGGRERER